MEARYKMLRQQTLTHFFLRTLDREYSPGRSVPDQRHEVHVVGDVTCCQE